MSTRLVLAYEYSTFSSEYKLKLANREILDLIQSYIVAGAKQVSPDMEIVLFSSAPADVTTQIVQLKDYTSEELELLLKGS